ncbi:MAG: type II secretion system inner membrane protein GspF [Nitrospira sp.]|nr:type II secretion system inner membrane protein GspF [Nitrospira sp.]
MAVYEYKGLTTEGRNVSGIVDADNPKTARFKLRKSGIFPVEVLESHQARTAMTPSHPAAAIPQPVGGRLLKNRLAERVTIQELAVVTRQMATLLGAGLPLLEVLSALGDQVEKRLLKWTIAQVREQVKEGRSFADALAMHPRIFSPVYIQMIRVGEVSGTLDQILLYLAQFLERQGQLRSRVLSSMAYPIFMLAVSALVLVFLLNFVVPRVLSVFSDVHQVLPLPTRILINITWLLQGYWWLFLVLMFVGGLVITRYLATPVGREKYDGWKLKAPLVGKLVKLIALSRFADTLSILLRGGVPLLQAFDIVKKVVNNRILENALEAARENIREGESIAEPLRRSGVFPPLVTRMIAVGEASAELERMLQKVAEAYQNEVDITLGTLMSLLAPLMILVMGLVVLFIVMAILLPILEMSQLVR